jgi:hypothetical protein
VKLTRSPSWSRGGLAIDPDQVVLRTTLDPFGKQPADRRVGRNLEMVREAAAVVVDEQNLHALPFRDEDTVEDEKQSPRST